MKLECSQCIYFIPNVVDNGKGYCCRVGEYLEKFVGCDKAVEAYEEDE